EKDVEGDGDGPELASFGQGRDAAQSDLGAVAAAVQLPDQELCRLHVVLDDQNQRTGAVGRGARRQSTQGSIRLDLRLPRRKADREDAALAELAGDAYFTAMQLRQSLGQGQAQAGPLLLASGAAVQLLEFLEELVEVVRGDTLSRVRDRDLDGGRKAARIDPDESAFGRELDGVGREIQQHLIHLAGVDRKSLV